ncbi:MAG: creatininase family protein [Chitinispirillaceae bacterium]|nr:creatininase family protein [Chitinispirillaceae bacterium]
MSDELSCSPLRVADLSFLQIEKHIERSPSLILPIGALEPMGDTIPLGAVNSCCEMIADALSDCLKVLVAPLLAYGNSTPFQSFGGSAGVHRDTLANVVMECCNSWLFQGFKRIMVLTLAMDGRQWIDSAAKRLNGVPGRDDSVRFCSLQDDDRFRSFCSSRFTGTEYGRSEWGVRALAGYLQPGLQAGLVVKRKSDPPDATDFTQWHRRGRDPEKLRKMAPAASFSASADGIDTGSGKELFEHIIAFLTEEFSPFLIVKDNASR